MRVEAILQSLSEARKPNLWRCRPPVEQATNQRGQAAPSGGVGEGPHPGRQKGEGDGDLRRRPSGDAASDERVEGGQPDRQYAKGKDEMNRRSDLGVMKRHLTALGS